MVTTLLPPGNLRNLVRPGEFRGLQGNGDGFSITGARPLGRTAGQPVLTQIR